jgi:prepilin-type processing-associated H-X9-DG protein
MKQADDRRLLREYLLGTLPAEQQEEARKRLDADVAFQRLLEEEQATLARLDVLPEVQPPPDLKERTLERIRPARPSRWQRSLIEAGIAVGLVVVMAAILLPALGRARESAHRSSSQNNLKLMGLIFKMYANEQRSFFPPVTPVSGAWMCDLSTICPEYLTDASTLVDPGSTRITVADMQEIVKEQPLNWHAFTRAAAESYVYLGWVVRDDADVQAVVEAREKMSPEQLSQDIRLADRTLPRLKEGVEQLYCNDPANPTERTKITSEIVVMFERQDHNGTGRYVLYFDGHVAFVPRGTFPCTDAVDQALGLR